MPTENRSSNTEMVSVPPYIGLEPLVGLYYPAQCRSCGWVGSSEELTEDDAQCTRDIGDRLCLGDCDELGRDDLLGIIQAMAKSAQQHQGGPVAVVDEGDDGLFVELIYGDDGNPLRRGDKLYTHADPAEFEQLREHFDQVVESKALDYRLLKGENDTLRTKLAERDALLREVLSDMEEIFPTGKTANKVRDCLFASAEPSAVIDEARDSRDYAIEHAGYLADAADKVLADYQAYSLAQMLENEGGDDGDTELEEAVDSARDDLHEGLANLRGMAYEFRKRRHQAANAASTGPQVKS